MFTGAEYFSNQKTMKYTFFTLILLLVLAACQPTEPQKADTFKVVFITDSHLQDELRAPEAFALAVDSINKLNPDLVLHGGDIIMDALAYDHERSLRQFAIYDSLKKFIQPPVYEVLGNHDIWAWYLKDTSLMSHPDYGKAMYERLLAPRYRKFVHKNWQFFMLDGLMLNEENKYYGRIDDSQMAWIEGLLNEIDTLSPIAIVTHIPLMTVSGQLWNGPTAANSPGIVVTNADTLLKLFERHNLSLVLQGHLHILEEIKVNNTVFITGGALSARWWRGPNGKLEEGFMLLELGEHGLVDAKYIDYGWEAQ